MERCLMTCQLVDFTHLQVDLTNLQILHTCSDSYDAFCLLGVRVDDCSLFVWR